MDYGYQPRISFFQHFRQKAGQLQILGFFVLLAVMAVSPAHGQKFSVVDSFVGTPDAANPRAGLVEDSKGNLYGTSAFGGANGVGSIFRVDKAGNESVVYSFDITHGAFPLAALIVDSTDNLYGTASVGGAHSQGVVFEFSTRKSGESTLYDFTGQNDGGGPSGGLARDDNGNLYGTAMTGGAFGGGVVFKLTTKGKFIVMHSFCSKQNCADGQGPTAGLTIDPDFNLYGTTQYGGYQNCSGGQASGCGVIFRVTQKKKETVLYAFCPVQNCTDGANPVAGVIRDTSGNLYGTTFSYGNPNNGCGTVFKLDSSRAFAVLYSFNGVPDGCGSEANLLFGGNNVLYGTTVLGGDSNFGTVFKLAANEKVLHSFNGGDGAGIYGSLILNSNGKLYGTANTGGSFGDGTVFKLKP